MCQIYINEYESCHHNKLDRTEPCWQSFIETYLPFLAACLYPTGSHGDVRIPNPVHGMCDSCTKRNQQNTRRDYGGFTAQLTAQLTQSAESSRDMAQVQASVYPWGQIQPSDYSCGGLNVPPMRSPENSYQPQAYPTQGHQHQAQANNPPQPNRALGSRALGSEEAPRPGYGYARALQYQRYVSQPSRQPSNHRHSNSNSFVNSSEPSPYEIQATVGRRDSILSENGRAPAQRTRRPLSPIPSPYEIEATVGRRDSILSENGRAPAQHTRRPLSPIPSPHELEHSLNNSDSVDSLSAAAKKTTRSRTRRRPKKSGTRGNVEIKDKLPRPAPEPGHCEQKPVPRRVATLRREHGPSSIDPVSPLTESDLSAPFVTIPEHDQYPEYDVDSNYPARI
ncbi:hypothetical protein NW752_003757 [Fusarium irregulare]|uniref:Uncharacterized protein n=1 Tax=Fusarium irregulare TaxID=2494466 RepID=A0A9W8UC69_9HYPO|nr:hypothetical protein NW766_004828 [Fusarium irregulare]KAJ4023295.1 hypothetical protein NW752_003757 [Fusarium irregulare]